MSGGMPIVRPRRLQHRADVALASARMSMNACGRGQRHRQPHIVVVEWRDGTIDEEVAVDGARVISQPATRHCRLMSFMIGIVTL